MENIFSGRKVYADGWHVVNTRDFSAEEISAVKSATVVSSEFGLSVCFFMKSGGQTYIPLSRDSHLSVGDSLDLNDAQILTLHREGQSNINRIQA